MSAPGPVLPFTQNVPSEPGSPCPHPLASYPCPRGPTALPTSSPMASHKCPQLLPTPHGHPPGALMLPCPHPYRVPSRSPPGCDSLPPPSPLPRVCHRAPFLTDPLLPLFGWSQPVLHALRPFFPDSVPVRPLTSAALLWRSPVPPGRRSRGPLSAPHSGHTPLTPFPDAARLLVSPPPHGLLSLFPCFTSSPELGVWSSCIQCTQALAGSLQPRTLRGSMLRCRVVSKPTCSHPHLGRHRRHPSRC